MLGNADRDLQEVVHFLSIRGLEAGYLVPTKTGLEKAIMDAHAQLSGYLLRSGLHDYAQQGKGTEAKAIVKTWIVKSDSLCETKSSLYRPETKSGDPRIWIYDLAKHATAGNLLALFAHEGELYVVNTSVEGFLETADSTSGPLSHVFDLLAAAKNKPLDDKFSEWNLRLLRSYFSEASNGEEVFLRVDKDALDQIGQDIGGDAGFLEAVRAGPAWARNSSLTQRILELVNQRRLQTRGYKDPGNFDTTYRGLRAPAYLPYLAALVRNDSVSQNAYYSRLQIDLKLQHQFDSVEMGRVEPAWEDLQAWTATNNGRFGFFRLRRLGGYSRIGVPRSQSILKPSDVEDLARVFVQAEVRPDQDLSDGDWATVLSEARSAQATFTAAFQDALGIPAFEQPILATIRNAYSDWDGTLPARHSNLQNAGEGAAAATGPSIRLCLSVVADEPLELSPLWGLPAIQDVGSFRLAHGGTSWQGVFSGTEGAATNLAADKAATVWKIAEKAFDHPVSFDMECLASDGSEPSIARVDLGKRQLWILSASFGGPTGSIELRESELPGSGQAYLLAPPRNVAGLEGYLEREKPQHSLITAVGLPKDWLLVCLDDCASLTSEQRLLPDGENAHPRPRAIRFAGGRSVRRGYSRMYLPYDLPVIELDAPAGARLECEGVRLKEVDGGHELTSAAVQFKPRKRYRIELVRSNSASYEVRALSDGAVLSKAKLRIAGLGGELVETGQPFSLDSLGNPLSSNEGLLGVLPPPPSGEQAPTLADDDCFVLAANKLGDRTSLAPGRVGAHELFLDSLAQGPGSIDYGVARDQILRLQIGRGEHIDPPLFLLDLRSRGHLEISTTHKGHISRIHAVPPTVHELPISSSGKRVYGITGTLRLTHWKQLESDAFTGVAYRATANDKSFKALRLLSGGEDSVKAACERGGFRFSSYPAIAIAEWSSPVDYARAETFRNPIESIGNAREGAVMFNASKGRFTAHPTGNQYEQLWKVRDLDTGMDNVYVLRNTEGRFAFVRDRRWGIWIALDALARWVSPRIQGVHPVPITYSRVDGTVWLPARLNLPFALERALILCCGDAPDVFDLKPCADVPESDRIRLAARPNMPPQLAVNRFYHDMKTGTWLAYRCVPERVAVTVAKKLGATLDFI